AEAQKMKTTIKDNVLLIHELQSQLQKKDEEIDNLRKKTKELESKITGKRPREKTEITKDTTFQRNTTQDDQNSAKKQRTSKIVVTFSGFKKGLVDYEPVDKSAFEDIVKDLDGQVLETREKEKLPDLIT